MRKTYKRYPTQKGDWDYITPDKARQLGYVAYAGPYKPVAEQWMVDNAVADIIKNGRDKYAVVPVGASIEIHILPNYYGIPNHTSAFKLQTFHEIERDEKAELAKETLAQVEAAEEKIEAIKLQKSQPDAGVSETKKTMDHQPSDMSGDGLLQTDSGHSSQKGQNGTNVDGDIALDVSLPFSSQSNPQQP